MSLACERTFLFIIFSYGLKMIISCLVSFSRIYVLASYIIASETININLQKKKKYMLLYHFKELKLSCHIIISHHMSAI